MEPGRGDCNLDENLLIRTGVSNMFEWFTSIIHFLIGYSTTSGLTKKELWTATCKAVLEKTRSEDAEALHIPFGDSNCSQCMMHNFFFYLLEIHTSG